ncbi:hypothetical protein [Prauserella muralis]|uniref:hypothetical protein n=1 Tax=Prauserella muralis TaxID=588067 RepID=UPI0011ABCD3E|nr:hypothetical protein FHX69_0695 [Prauserella muralis]
MGRHSRVEDQDPTADSLFRNNPGPRSHPEDASQRRWDGVRTPRQAGPGWDPHPNPATGEQPWIPRTGNAGEVTTAQARRARPASQGPRPARRRAASPQATQQRPGRRQAGAEGRRPAGSRPQDTPRAAAATPRTERDEDRGDSATTTTTGTHRAIGRTRRRVAAWPIACAVLAALVAAGWFGWNWADGVLATRAEAQASDCAEGDAAIRVLADPGVTTPVAAAAKSWNDARKVVHGHCVRVDVQAVPADRVLDELLGKTGRSYVDGSAAAWVPESSSAVERLSSAKPGLIGSQPESVASGQGGDYPYVGLAQDGIDDVEQRAAQSFRAFLLDSAQRAAFTKAGLSAP